MKKKNYYKRQNCSFLNLNGGTRQFQGYFVAKQQLLLIRLFRFNLPNFMRFWLRDSWFLLLSFYLARWFLAHVRVSKNHGGLFYIKTRPLILYKNLTQRCNIFIWNKPDLFLHEIMCWDQNCTKLVLHQNSGILFCIKSLTWKLSQRCSIFVLNKPELFSHRSYP